MEFNSKIIILIEILSNIFHAKVEALVESSDFSKCVQNKAKFIDKTMMIKEFLNVSRADPVVKVITAPKNFGKSTIIDMIKRFSETVVDENGNQTRPNTTENYKLFCDNKLKICEDETFIKTELGQTPVIYINYGRLEAIEDYDSFQSNLSVILSESYAQHDYLLQRDEFWPRVYKMKRLDFEGYLNCTKVGKHEMRLGFILLAEVLYIYFRRKVILLMDEYDSFFYKLLLYDHLGDVRQIVRLLESISSTFIKGIKFVRKILVTGILRVSGLGSYPEGKGAQEYRFLGDHSYSRYYGFTHEEVLELLQRNIRDETKRNRTEVVLKDYYNGYQIQNQNLRSYCIRSVLKFFESDMKPTSYWVRSNYIRGVASLLFRIGILESKVKRTVIKRKIISGDVSEPLPAQHFLELIKRNTDEDGKFDDLMYVLFDLGYLTTIGNNIDVLFIASLEIPNKEIHIEYCRLLTTNYIYEYNYNRDYVRTLVTVVDSFKFNQNNLKVYKSFYEILNRAITGSNHYPESVNDIQSFLFVAFGSQYNVNRTQSEVLPDFIHNDTYINNLPDTLKKQAKEILEIFLTSKGTNEDEEGTDLIVGNTQNMAFVLSTITQDKSKRINCSIDDLAKVAVIRTLLNYDLNKNPVMKFDKSYVYSKRVIFIGLAYDTGSRNISMSFYYPFFDKKPSFINS